MKNKIPLKILALLAITTGDIFAKSTPLKSSISFLSPIETTQTANSFMLTPLELIQPTYFEPSSLLDFSMAFNLFWF